MTLNENRSVFICQSGCCCFPGGFSKANRRIIGVYFSGVLFTLAWWIFVDGVITSARMLENPAPPGFEDWASGIVLTLGMIIVHSIDLQSLRSDSDMYSYDSDYSRVWFCRLMMFLGSTMLAGGLVGSVVVLVFNQR
ncbi:hypothetical protein F4703DRAFT_1179321 [Phycomyces blakesleeanus]|uniref:Uncharacterized protein n=1 Tax=Phycomyces blakesleeanus (strain ATCC 8743b / DSM 1359 / FGSC 10004 / NBRC 33097 / NRRL 1555) TaxID=763407 RepID=A0A162PHF5_PHYB8|nr:hypothetical protein PHYBLDRAFT_181654 [Phycomyces blakesleeanus NRRL 1555(-)]OAD72867.1 hypothetical protein PHYBLDRAFT_181654 [Phycomyces blakesleeanus NRRL 1555(-)]|eukprot:XP_018290907.1 hypothetical protein PHYBLDRAFT_181654 [Phycomyces blakesleeanus NRRL 1555(-)]